MLRAPGRTCLLPSVFQHAISLQIVKPVTSRCLPSYNGEGLTGYLEGPDFRALKPLRLAHRVSRAPVTNVGNELIASSNSEIKKSQCYQSTGLSEMVLTGRSVIIRHRQDTHQTAASSTRRQESPR